MFIVTGGSKYSVYLYDEMKNIPQGVSFFEVADLPPGSGTLCTDGSKLWRESDDLYDLERKQEATARKLQMASAFMVRSYTGYSDAEALLVSEIFPTWPNGTGQNGKYQKNQFLLHENRLYQVVQETAPQQDQPPNAEGMLAIYRPIDTVHAGTRDDPIPFAYGMDCYEQLYYLYSGMVYQCRADMLPCVWTPDTPGLWQWSLIT